MVQVLPLHLAQLICQRCNAWWDSKLRMRYAGALQGISVAMIVLVLAVGLPQSRKVDDLILTVYVPLSPLVIWSLKGQRRHAEAANFSARLQALAEETWSQAIRGALQEADILSLTRELQDAMYYRRRTAPFIPDWIQNQQKHRYLELIAASVEEMIDQATQARFTRLPQLEGLATREGASDGHCGQKIRTTRPMS
jgi:SMODS-associating 4TM effector domain